MNETRARQAIRYLRTTDGVRLAWAEAGRGRTLVKAANWLTHLELEWQSPVWRHWIRFFSDNFRFVRYDERGCGMSDWEVRDLGQGRWAADLEEVVAAASTAGAASSASTPGATATADGAEPVVLLGISQGAAPAIEFAVRHPQRVSHLILYGGYSQGWAIRGDEASRRRYQAMLELIEHGWGRSNPVFRQLFTSRFIPGGSDEQLDWFNELCLKTTSPQNAVRLLQTRAQVDVLRHLAEVRVPTLVLHGRNDDVVPLGSGKILAAEIPGAEFVELDSRNHVLLELEPAWQRFQDAVTAFVPAGAVVGDPAFSALSPRERQVLALMADGLSNTDIAERLQISDKTVRNHASNLFDKLGVWSRAQAIVFARDRGFSA